MENQDKDLAGDMARSFPQQRREWRIQRIAWIFLYGLLLAIILGLLGGGPLSKSRLASSDGSLHVEYEAFVRHHSSDALQITLRAASDIARMELDSQYVRGIRIEKVTPAPERVIAGEEALTFVFHVRPDSAMQAVIEFRPEKLGSLKGWVAIPGQPRQRFRQFVYP